MPACHDSHIPGSPTPPPLAPLSIQDPFTFLLRIWIHHFFSDFSGLAWLPLQSEPHVCFAACTQTGIYIFIGHESPRACRRTSRHVGHVLACGAQTSCSCPVSCINNPHCTCRRASSSPGASSLQSRQLELQYTSKDVRSGTLDEALTQVVQDLVIIVRKPHFFESGLLAFDGSGLLRERRGGVWGTRRKPLQRMVLEEY